jgi:hypothetical protein
LDVLIKSTNFPDKSMPANFVRQAIAFLLVVKNTDISVRNRPAANAGAKVETPAEAKPCKGSVIWCAIWEAQLFLAFHLLYPLCLEKWAFFYIFPMSCLCERLEFFCRLILVLFSYTLVIYFQIG